tara:strand:+ start:310 stop:657 length:348 start_codon:yes stop_codon:yes gene_type:complete
MEEKTGNSQTELVRDKIKQLISKCRNTSCKSGAATMRVAMKGFGGILRARKGNDKNMITFKPYDAPKGTTVLYRLEKNGLKAVTEQPAYGMFFLETTKRGTGRNFMNIPYSRILI